MPLPRRAALASCLLLPGLLRAAPAAAAGWPSRPLRFVVPFAPGGPVEPAARLVAEHLSPRLGQPVVVELRPGAAGAIGARDVAHSTDGHSFLFTTGGLAVIPALQKDPGFDLARDLAPISLIAETPMAVVVKADSPVASIPDLLARARSQPGRIAYGSSGVGSTTHLAWLLLEAKAGIELLHVPYRGAGQAINGVYTGEIDIYMGDLGLLLPHVRDNRFRLLAVTSAQPVALVPDAPTIASTVADYDMTIWYELLGPRSTPAEVIQRLSRDIAPLRDTSTLATRIAAGGGTMVLSTPEHLATRLRSEVTLWRDVLQRAGIQPE